MPTELALIEDAGLNAAATPDTLVLDGWLMRLCPSKAKRSRCINALGPGQLPVVDKLVLARDVYAQRGLALFVRITPFSPPGLDDALAVCGLTAIDDTHVMVCPDLPAARAAASASRPAADLARRGLQIDAVTSASYCSILGTQRHTPAAMCQAHAERLRHSPVPHQAFVVRDADGQVLAGGQSAREGTRVGLYDVFTTPCAQGQGLGRALCGYLLDQACAQGARTAYLQVEHDNAPARAVYHRLGFVDAYGYHYRTPAAPAGAG